MATSSGGLLFTFVNKTTRSFKLKEGNAGVYRDIGELTGCYYRNGDPADPKYSRVTVGVDDKSTYKEFRVVAYGKPKTAFLIYPDSFLEFTVLNIILNNTTGEYETELCEPRKWQGSAIGTVSRIFNFIKMSGKMDSSFAGTIDSRISVVLDIINRVKVLDGHFQINQHQCKRLVGFYCRVGQFFDQLKEYFNDADYQRLSSLPSLDVTISVLQKGQLLVTKYTEENWFDSMVTAGVNQDSFIAIHVELGECIRLIHDAVVKQGVAIRMQVATVAPLLFLDEEDSATVFKGDAEKDKKHMLEKIEARKIATSNARNTKQKVSEIRSLDMASEKIIMTNDQQSVGTEELPSYLQIESSEIEVLDRIGGGGSAEVYKCRWLHRDFAVKIFQSNDVAGLRKEVGSLIALGHPNIVQLVGFSIRRKPVYNPMVVMELLDGDLHSLISNSKHRSPFPIGLAIDFIYQIAAGMTYIHKKKLFHGDLKALNVLVKRHEAGFNQRWELKISDFGVSEKLILKNDHIGYDSDCTSFSTANVGTTRWRAPEVFDVTEGDLKPYSMKADVYSFSMTCVEILTRQVPFHYLPTKVIKGHVKAGNRPNLPKDVPEDLRNLVVRCWDHDPARRPDFSDICASMLELKERSSLDVEEMEDLGSLSRVLLRLELASMRSGAAKLLRSWVRFVRDRPQAGTPYVTHKLRRLGLDIFGIVLLCIVAFSFCGCVMMFWAVIERWMLT